MSALENGKVASFQITNESGFDGKCFYTFKNAKTSPSSPFIIKAGISKQIVDIYTQLKITCTIMVGSSEKSCTYNGDFLPFITLSMNGLDGECKVE